MSKMLPLVAGLVRECFPDSLPDEELLAYLKLPAAGLEESLISLVDAGPMEVPLALMFLLPDDDGGFRSTGLLMVVRESFCLNERIGVHPDRRGRDYVAGLLAAATLSGQDIGIRRWGVELREQDLASQQFFRHMGFKALPATDESRGWFGKEDAVVRTRTV